MYYCGKTWGFDVLLRQNLGFRCNIAALGHKGVMGKQSGGGSRGHYPVSNAIALLERVRRVPPTREVQTMTGA
jgi:hypothetical protein